MPTCFAALDKLLPDGGWPQRTLIELLAPCGVGEMRLLMPILAPLMRAGQTVVWVEPPHIPYPRALTAQGAMLEQLLVVRARDRAQRLWAIEQTLKTGAAAAVVAWLPEDNTHLTSFQTLRRLQLAAQGMKRDPGLVFLMRSPAAHATASPAPLRIELAACARGVALDIFKRRGMPAQAMQLKLPRLVLRRFEALSEENSTAEAAEVAIVDAVDCRLSA
ncbi:MAG: translesion DNA synthesis-associated protein ImuA [Pseudomonadota bacterium]|nr:translesion DNA synthesis-associated protein ImuA [Pseudomonadota bacterium]